MSSGRAIVAAAVYSILVWCSAVCLAQQATGEPGSPTATATVVLGPIPRSAV